MTKARISRQERSDARQTELSIRSDLPQKVIGLKQRVRALEETILSLLEYTQLMELSAPENAQKERILEIRQVFTGLSKTVYEGGNDDEAA